MNQVFGAPMNEAKDPYKAAAMLRSKAKQCLMKNKYSEACALLTEAVQLQPDSHKLYRLRSLSYACMQDFEASLADAEKVIAIMPKAADGYYHRGFALYQLKMYSEAARAFQDGLRVNPHDRILKQGFWDAMALLSQSD